MFPLTGPATGAMRGRPRTATCLLLSGLLASFTGTALADPDPTKCIAAHADGQELESQGKLVEAAKLFASCATSDCPKVIQKDCKVMGAAAEKALATITIVALDHTGQPLSNPQLEVDGKPLASQTLPQPISLDPGQHHIRLYLSGHSVSEVSIPLQRGDKNQRAVIQLVEPVPEVGKARNAGYVLAGVGAVGLLSFAGFALSGYQDRRKLDESSVSADRDTLERVDRMRQKYLIADISLGIGLVSLGAATYLLLATQPTHAPALGAPKTALFLGGTPSGGGVSFHTQF